jgi:hypothetical protein
MRSLRDLGEAEPLGDRAALDALLVAVFRELGDLLLVRLEDEGDRKAKEGESDDPERREQGADRGEDG